MPSTTPRGVPYPLPADNRGVYPTQVGKPLAEWIDANFQDLVDDIATKATTIPVMSGWTWNRDGGTVYTSGAVHTLNIDIKRAAATFSRAANEAFAFATIPSSIHTPSSLIYAGVLIGGGWVNPVYIQNGSVYCYCDKASTITSGWDYRASLTWIA